MEYAHNVLTCRNEEIVDYRRKAAMIEDLVEELSQRANKGDLKYG